MRNSRSKRRGRPPKSTSTNNNSKYLYSKISKVENEDDESNLSTSTNNTSSSKYQTRSGRRSGRLTLTISTKGKGRKRKRNDDSEEEGYFEYEDDYEKAPQSDDEPDSDADDDTDVESDDLELDEEESEDNDLKISIRIRPSRDNALIYLDDKDVPELTLPSSSEDLLISGKNLLQSLSIYEILRRFQNTLRLTPFRFEDFCVCLLIDEQTYLLSEIHIQLLKALIREDDLIGTQHGPQDLRDSINIYLHLCDHVTWPEVLRIYLSSDIKKNSPIIENYIDTKYPYSSIENKLALLEYLCEEFLNTQSVREVLNNEGVIKHDDICRVCHKLGDLLCCETCNAVFHLGCLEPPMKQIPAEEWVCPICKQNSVTGVSDCISDIEKQGLLCRQEPIGWDRHGRKYWFISRRIFVEDRKDSGKVSYYSTRLQLDELIAVLDEEYYEKDLCTAFDEMHDEIYRQMAITEKLTKAAKGNRKSYLEAVNEELFLKQSHKIKTENADEAPTVVDTEKLVELESKLTVDDDDLRSGVQTRLKTGSLQLKPSMDAFRNRLSNYNSICVFRDEDTVIVFSEDSKSLTRQLRKTLPLDFNQMNLFKLGVEGNYRNYQNVYSLNPHALNRYQLADERDKKRHLSHKFSLTSTSELKWAMYGHVSMALSNLSVNGTQSMLISVIRQALLYLETQFTQTFMHPNWNVHRANWIKAVSMCSEPKEFSLALYILESSMKPVLFNSAWHDSLGFTVLQRSTQSERDELKKRDKKERRNETESSNVDSDMHTSRYYGLGVGVKFPFGKLKHQIWKQKGEEYRLCGIGGWNWTSNCKLMFGRKQQITAVKTPIEDVDQEVIDISSALQDTSIYHTIENSQLKVDTLLDSRIEMFKLQSKLNVSNKDKEVKRFHCYSPTCKSASKCYSPLCPNNVLKSLAKQEEIKTDTSKPVVLLKIVEVDGVKQFGKRVIPFLSKGQLPPSGRFSNGKYKSILILPTYELRKLCRNGGLREVYGFSYNSKVNNAVWNYGLTPRPFFRTTWLYRTHNLNSLHSASLQLRVLWSSVRWDELAMKPPVSGTNTITTENDVQTIEILKRRDLPPFGLRSEYLVRKIIVPIDLPTKQREVSTPNRSGLRERKRPESPQVKGPRMTESWVIEEEIEIWEIRQFYEKQQALNKQRQLQEDKQRQLEMLQKKNEERRLSESNKTPVINGTVNLNPSRSIASRFSSIFQNRANRLISSAAATTIAPSTSSASTQSVTYATIRTANGQTFRIPVSSLQNKTGSPQQFIIRSGNQVLAANSSPQTILTTTGTTGLQNRTATYIVRSPAISSTRPIIIANPSLNSTIIRPINSIQTNVRQSIPLIATSSPQKISTMTTVNAILTPAQTKAITSTTPSIVSSTTSTILPTVNIAASPTLNTTKNIQCVPLKTSDGRTHLLPLSSFQGNQTVQIAVNSNQFRILTKQPDVNKNVNTTTKPIIVTNNSILPSNTLILSGLNNQKVVLQPANAVPANTVQTAVVRAEPPKPTILTAVKATTEKAEVKTPVEPKTAPANEEKKPPAAVASKEEDEKDFIVTSEMTQEIVRKALMNPNVAPEIAQKLMALQRHHKEQAEASRYSPVGSSGHSHHQHHSTPVGSRTSSRASTSRYSTSRFESDDYVYDYPKPERSSHRHAAPEDDVAKVCRNIVKSLVDKIEKDEKRIKYRELLEERRQKKALALRLKYRQNHVELVRRSIMRRKAKFNHQVKTIAENEVAIKYRKTENLKVKDSVVKLITKPVATSTPLKRKLENDVGENKMVNNKSNSLKPYGKMVNNHEPRNKRVRLSQTTPPKKDRSLKSNSRNDGKLYCICKKPYDYSFMIGCDNCSNWFHPACIKISEDQVKTIKTYICDVCLEKSNDSLIPSSPSQNEMNSKSRRQSTTPRKKLKTKQRSLNNNPTNDDEHDQSLYCICRKPYDSDQFYIYCDQCCDWFHGRCVGITFTEAENIDEYICPQCEGGQSSKILNIKNLDEEDFAKLHTLLKSMKVISF